MILDGDISNSTSILPNSFKSKISMNWIGTRNLSVLSNITFP
jgi:hypothetical protein